MPAANTYRINELSRFLMCSVESVYDQEETLAATDVFATMGLQGEVYNGDTEQISFDGGDGVDMPQLTSNPYNGFSFEFFGSGSGSVGVPPQASKIFRACGANEYVIASEAATDSSAARVTYRSGDVRDLDSGTFKMFQKVGEDKYLQYLTTGARGQVGFSFQDGKIPRFSVSNLIGRYHKPTVLNAAQGTYYGDQKTVLPLEANFENTAALEYGGHQLCVDSLSIDNIFGMSMSRKDQPGCRSTNAKRVTPEIKLKFRMPNWEQAFNPYEKASTENGIQREQFMLQIGNTGQNHGNILRIFGDGDNETQLVSPKETTLSDGNVGIEATLLCLSGLAVQFR